MKATLRAGSALVLSSFALLAMSAPAAAQSAPAPAPAPAPLPSGAAPTAADEAAPGDIVVTAQKRSENLQQVPLAVSVLSGAALAQTARPSIEGAAQLVPSLNFLKAGTTLNQTIFLRGVGTASFSIAGEPSVSTVVDGVVYARSGEAFSDLIDIAQLEVLRGPQGTLFGKNASAGVINITTLMPRHELGGSVEASYFSNSEYRGKASVNLPLGPDLAARFTGFYGQYDGNLDNVTLGRKVNGYKHYGGRAQLLYDPSADLRIYLTADYHKNDDDCCAVVVGTGPLTGAGVATTDLSSAVVPVPYGFDTRTIAQNTLAATKEEGWGVSGQVDLGVGSHTLTSITSYRKWNNTEFREGDFLPAAYVGYGQVSDVGPQKTNTFTQELRLTSPTDQTISYVLGGYYSRAFSERVFRRDGITCTAVTGAPTTALIPCGSANANASTPRYGIADFGSTFKNVAVFGQAVLHLTDNFRMIGGLRYSQDNLSIFHSRVAVGLPVVAGLPVAASIINPAFDQGVYNAYLAFLAAGQTPAFAVANAPLSANGVPFRASSSHHDLSGKIGFQADLTSDHVGYVTYTRGYKGPAYNTFFNLAGTGTNIIAAETSDALEAGLKNKFFGGRMTLNIAIFLAKYHNFQANNPDLVAGAIVSRFTNAGEVSTRGVEADLNWRPIDDLTISGGVALTHARVDNFLAPPGATAAQLIVTGTPLQYAPEWKGSLSADYRVRTGGAVDVFLGASGNFQSSQLSVFGPNPVQRQFGTIPAYGLVNVSAGIGDSGDRFRLTLQVRNLFDKSYAASIAPGGPGGAYLYLIPRDADRYFGITGRANF